MSRDSMNRCCIKCGRTAQNPMLPLCMECDLARLANGETADDIRREAAALRAKEPR
jgi:NMD protein affecting ribosome stability and mRNA decay